MRAIIVNGSAGAGKTTLLNLLAEQDLNKYALLDGDHLVRIVPFEISSDFLNIVIDNIVTCARNFMEYNYNVTVIGFVFPTQERLSLLVEKLRNIGIEVRVLNLYCEDEVLKKRIIERNTSKLVGLQKAVDINQSINKLDCDYFVDTTNLRNDDLIKLFLKYIKEDEE